MEDDRHHSPKGRGIGHHHHLLKGRWVATTNSKGKGDSIV